jgi:hypothetical protein
MVYPPDAADIELAALRRDGFPGDWDKAVDEQYRPPLNGFYSDRAHRQPRNTSSLLVHEVDLERFMAFREAIEQPSRGRCWPDVFVAGQEVESECGLRQNKGCKHQHHTWLPHGSAPDRFDNDLWGRAAARQVTARAVEMSRSPASTND